jgi:glycosyltransferase involved in cell wall biosynthesis
MLIGTTYVHNILLPLIVKNTTIRTIGCEHEVYDYPPKLLQTIRKFAYPKLDSVVVLNETEQKKFHFLKNTVIIPNSLPFEKNKCSSLTENKIIAVGRLTYQKGFDMLIDIYEGIYRQAPSWELNIIGDGEDFEILESKIKAKGLEQQIKLCGSVKNISEYYQESSIFVLTSRWESFGIVILEALNHGLPVVSFDCDGPKNIINENESGFLIPQFDQEKFSEKVLLIIKDKEKRKEMGKVAQTTSLKYQEKNIIPLWNKLIQSTLKVQQSK